MGTARSDRGFMPAAYRAAWLATLGAVAGLLHAGLTDAQISRLADLRIRLQRGDYAADGGRASAPSR